MYSSLPLRESELPNLLCSNMSVFKHVKSHDLCKDVILSTVHVAQLHLLMLDAMYFYVDLTSLFSNYVMLYEDALSRHFVKAKVLARASGVYECLLEG